MARPLVLIFQELTQTSSTPTTPDLNTVVVGPAYDLFDYPDDAATILFSQAYGTLESTTLYTPPTAGTDAVLVLDGAYPGQSAGSIVDTSSVAVTLQQPHVILGSTYLSGSIAPVLGSTGTTTSADRTLVTIAGADLVANGIQPGDRVIMISGAGTPQTFVGTIQTVGEPNALGLVETANKGKFRLTAQLAPSGTGAGQWDYTDACELRIERVLDTQPLVDTSHTFLHFPISGSTELSIRGGLTVSMPLTPVPSVSAPSPVTSTVTRAVSYAGLYVSYRALRQDLQNVNSVDGSAVTTVNTVPFITGIGKIDARNPLAVAMSLALQNAGSNPVNFYGVQSNDATGHLAARAAMEMRRDLYCFVPLTQDLNIHAAYKSEFHQMADPNYALANGLVQKFRICIGSIPLPTTSTIYSGSILGTAEQPSGVLTGLYRTLTIASASTGGTASLPVSTVLPGDTLTIGYVPSADASWQSRRGAHKIGHVNSSYVHSSTTSQVEVIPGTTQWNSTAISPSGDIEFSIKDAYGNLKAYNFGTAAFTNGGGTVTISMDAPVTVGGPYTVTFASGAALAVALSGFAITVTFVTGVTTAQNVTDAINADPVISALVTAAATNTTSALVVAGGPTSIIPQSGTCTATIDEDDALFNRLDDTSATFLTAGVKAGDTLQFPVDPNNYLANAFSGQLLTYTVASVLNENLLLIANGSDDTDTAANELPHYYSRTQTNHLITQGSPAGLSYRIIRALTKDQQVLALATTAQSVRNARLTLVWPDLHGVVDLRDGSLARSLPSVRSLAPQQPSYYLAAAVGGVICAIPPQAGMTNGSFIGIDNLAHAQGYFSERQYAQLSDGGFFACMQRVPGALPECIHQLTTDVTSLETGELSVVKNVDFISLFFQGVIEPFLGQYNVIPETLNEIDRAVSDGAKNLMSRKVARIGAPLLSAAITSIQVSSFSADRVELYFAGKVARPLNTVGFHLAV